MAMRIFSPNRLICAILGAVIAAAAAFASQSSEVAPAAEAQSDEDLWAQLQSLSGTQAEDELWDAAEEATERVFGRRLERDTGETVFQTLEAAADGDWRNAFETAGPELLNAYLPGVGQYVELIQSAAGQIDQATDRWAEQLYDHESYRWVGAQVDARVAAMNGPMLDDYGDPFYGRINDDAEAFMPSYALPDGSPAKQRARDFEAALFERFTQQPFYEELVATNWTSDGGGASGLYENSYAAMIREELGYQPEPRRLFNHFYHRYTRDRLARYQEVHEYVQAELMRREARRQRAAVIQAYREALEAEAPGVDQMLAALQANDVNAVRRGLAAGFDPNLWPEGASVPFMYMAGVTLAQNPSIQPVFDLLVEGGGEVRPDVPEGTPEVLPAAIQNADEAGALAVMDAGFRTDASYRSGDTVLAGAIVKGFPAVVQRLLAAGHDPQARSAEGHPMLMLAIPTGDTETLNALLNAGADVDARSTSTNGAAIHAVALHNQAALVPTLVNAGAQIDSLLSEAQPYSALMIAAMQGHFDTVRALVEAGADLTIESSRGTAADYARSNGHDEIADYLIDLYAVPPELSAEISRLVQPGGTGELVLMMDGEWRRPLQFSVEADAPNLVDIDEAVLTDADVYASNDPDQNGRLYLQAWFNARSEGVTNLAVTVSDASGHTETLRRRVLIGEGYSELRGRLVDAARAYDPQAVRDVISDINEMDAALDNDPSWLSQVFRDDCARGTYHDCDAFLGSFVAFHVAGTSDEALLDFMLESGADANYTATGGQSMLMNAVASGNRGQVDQLLQAGADPNLAPGGARPPLVSALSMERVDIAIALLQAGANPDVDLNAGGLTLLHVAAAWNDLDLINALLSAGARIRNDREGNPPGHVSYFAHDDLQLALRLGYDEAREYEARERRRNRPGFDWGEFARRMQPILEEGAAEIAAIQSEHNRRVREIERDYDEGMRRAERQARSQSQPYTPSSPGSNAPDFRSVERESGTGRRSRSVEPIQERSAPASNGADLPACQGLLTSFIVETSRQRDRGGTRFRGHGYLSACRTGEPGDALSVEWTRPVSVCGRVVFVDHGQFPSHRGASPVPVTEMFPELRALGIDRIRMQLEGQGEFRTCN